MTEPEPLYSLVVPWSGEVIPVPVEPLPVGPIPGLPSNLPSPDPIIQFVGAGEHAVWNDVWNWIKGASSAAVDVLNTSEAAIANAVLGTVENYVGNQLKALSGFIDSAYQYTLDVGNLINTFAVEGIVSLYNDVVFIDEILRQLLDDVKGIDNWIANLVPSIVGVVMDALTAEINAAIQNVESWAIDNIYNPLDGAIRDVETRVDEAIVGAAADVEQYARDLVNAEALQRLAEIAGILSAIAALQTFVEECGDPMCQVMGPKTDLGKLLKALDAAALLAIIAELAGEDFAGIEALLTGLADKAAQVVDFFDTYFVEGGDTLSELIGRL